MSHVPYYKFVLQGALLRFGNAQIGIRLCLSKANSEAAPATVCGKWFKHKVTGKLGRRLSCYDPRARRLAMEHFTNIGRGAPVESSGASCNL